MALFVRRAAGAALAAGLVAASMVAVPPGASAAPDHRFHGRIGPGFHGRGWYGPGYRYGYGYGYGGYRAIFPGYYGMPYAGYYYPAYAYPRYVVPSAVYVMPPRPAPAPAMAAPAQPREFTVYFDFDNYNLTPEARGVVDAAVAAARSGGPARIEVTGNTDLAGTTPYNDVLSRRRADAVRRYMVAHGVAASEIGVDAHGKADPAVRTADGIREPRNRRVEIVITPERGPRQQAPATSMMAPPAYGHPMVPADARMAPSPYGAPPQPVGPPTNLIDR